MLVLSIKFLPVSARHLHTNGRWTLTHKFAGNLLIKRILIASNCDAATAAGGARAPLLFAGSRGLRAQRS